jgi:nicotinate phosphoribosyltransferase
VIEGHTGLYTDLYELTMAQAYFQEGMAEKPAVFDYSFRTNPFGGGYAVFAGLHDLLDFLEEFRFGPEDLDYLKSRNFGREFLNYLGRLRFRGTVRAVREGETIFPLEPVLRIEGPLLQAQVVETAVLNILSFETLVATKAARIKSAAGPRLVSEFGLRRAHGWGGVQASRAAVIGGCDSTSNVYASWRYGLEPAGTMAHSFVESQESELEAFRRFARSHPDGCVLLVDTYETLSSGLPNAIRVGREMEARGRKLAAIRLDSGDLAYLAKEARRRLDEAGLAYVRIAVSNLLDEHLVKSLIDQGAPIDMFGVGTRLATGAPDAALDGIYKLAEVDGRPRLKISNSLSKSTLPGRKSIHRYTDAGGAFRADALSLDEEDGVGRMVHPFEPGRSLRLSDWRPESLLVEAMDGGRRKTPAGPIADTAAYARQRLAALPEEHKRFENPHLYKVGLGPGLAALRDRLVRELRREE